jgi:SAM-dependent methyltransferase
MQYHYYQDKPASYYSLLRVEVIRLLDESERFAEALELGCGKGETLRFLLGQRRVARAVGVEVLPAAAREAADHVSEVFEEDAEQWTQHPRGVTAPDLVIVADILEHLTDPWAVLRRLRALQPPDGVLLVSIPNIQHFSVSLPLLFRGRWRYGDAGILDRTHLRFFSREGAEDLLRGAGYIPEVWDFSAGTRGRLAVRLSLGLLRPWLAWQYLVRCRAA